ncbi:hypothetical protein V1478_002607 [Vespula squamosa]|uniref:Uncharacterized protein n=1 Tax=Vespula squamosa TaxID=30214 RepID=A0ABD2BT16_VESSQ
MILKIVFGAFYISQMLERLKIFRLQFKIKINSLYTMISCKYESNDLKRQDSIKQRIRRKYGRRKHNGNNEYVLDTKLSANEVNERSFIFVNIVVIISCKSRCRTAQIKPLIMFLKHEFLSIFYWYWSNILNCILLIRYSYEPKKIKKKINRDYKFALCDSINKVRKLSL